MGQHDLPTFGAALRAGQPEVLLVDSRMEGALGFCAALTREGGPAVILMAADEDDGFAVSALDTGACGILAKNARAEDLVKALRIVQEGQIWARRHLLKRGWSNWRASCEAAARANPPSSSG